MASVTSFNLLLLLLLPLILLIKGVNGIPTQELDLMLANLRSHRGYSLIANAISTSDIKISLLNIPSFTLFAPPDAAVFVFDASFETTASEYVSVLRSHFVPNRRLSALYLRRLSLSSAPLPSLLPSRSIRIAAPASGGDMVSVNGVDMVYPGLYYGRHLAVHGLAGILPLNTVSSSRSARHRRRAPRSRGRSNFTSAANRTAGNHLPRTFPVNRTFHSPPSMSADNRTKLYPERINLTALAPVSAPESAFSSHFPSPARSPAGQADIPGKDTSSIKPSAPTSSPLYVMAPSPSDGNENLEPMMPQLRSSRIGDISFAKISRGFRGTKMHLEEAKEAGEQDSTAEECGPLDGIPGHCSVTGGDFTLDGASAKNPSTIRRYAVSKDL